MVGWGPGHYIPIHDHPRGGSLINIVKGPGLLENTFWKPPEYHGSSYDYQYANVYDIYGDYLLEDTTKFYSCYSFQDGHISAEGKGCEIKNQTTAYITKTRTIKITKGGPHQVVFHKGLNRLHSLKNINKTETTLTLHHSLGGNEISWWLHALDETKLFDKGKIL